MSQTSVDSPMSIGSAGQLANARTVKDGDVVPGISEEASAVIPFGVLVMKGTNPGGIKNLTGAATAASIEGVLVRGEMYDPLTQTGLDANINLDADGSLGIKPKICGDVLRDGQILVIPEADGTELSEVHARIVVNGANTTLGAFTPTADPGKTLDLTPIARWRDGGPVAGEPSVLSIDMTNAALVEAD